MFKKLMGKIIDFGVKKFIICVVATILAAVVLGIGTCHVVTLVANRSGVENNNSSTNDDVEYEIIYDEVEVIEKVESNTTEDSSSNDEVVSEVNSNVADSSNEETIVNSEVPAVSQPVVETPSDDNNYEEVEVQAGPDPTTSTETFSKPTDALTQTPGAEYPTIQLEVPTTYYGYRGYFTFSGSHDDIHLVESGIGTDNSLACGASTEYFDIETRKCLLFIFEGTIVDKKNLEYNHVFMVGKSSTAVNVVY